MFENMLVSYLALLVQAHLRS